LTYPDQVQFVLASISLVSLVIPINVGGDHFKLLRFYQPYFPIYLFVLLNIPFWKQFLNVSINAAPNRYRTIIHALLLMPFIYFITDTPLHTYRKGKSPIQPEFDLAELGREEGQNMNQFFAPMKNLPSVGVSAAGGFAYGYKGHTNDLMGLNNVAMAHAKGKTPGIKNHESFDKKVFYEQSPEIFHGYKRLSKFVDSFNDTALYENTKKYEGSFAARLYKDMLKDQKFRDVYKPVIIADPRSKLFLKTYCHVEYLKQLQKNGYSIQELNKHDANYAAVSEKEEQVEEEVLEEEFAN